MLNSVEIEQSNSSATDIITGEIAENEVPENIPEEVPSYVMKKGDMTVDEVMKEYNHGYPGFLSVKQLEATYGNKWRKENRRTKFFYERKEIYNEVSRMVSNDSRITESEAIIRLEKRRTDAGWHISGLQKELRKERAGRVI